MPDMANESVGALAQMACVAEVMAPKAGNVHRGADFDSVTWRDFVTSAAVVRPILDRAAERGVGETVLECVGATRQAVGHNTNLGMLLLLAPLCAAAADAADRTDAMAYEAAVKRVLSRLSMQDARDVYAAIRLAQPGGLGTVQRQDVATAPTVTLIEAMRLAADRDAIARQYVNGFHDVLHANFGALCAMNDVPLEQVIVNAHLRQMAAEPDSLIMRKCGQATAIESQARARGVLDAGWPDAPEARRMFDVLDAWLRADGHRRNPGASADLVAAGLFVALRLGRVRPPRDLLRSISSAPT